MDYSSVGARAHPGMWRGKAGVEAIRALGLTAIKFGFLIKLRWRTRFFSTRGLRFE